MTDTLDSHGHVWTTPDEHAWVDDVTPPGADRVVYSLDDYRADMDTLGVDEAVLVATPIHGPGSPYTVSCVTANPETFYGIVLVDYDAPDVEAHLDDVFVHENLLGVRMTAEDLAAAPSAFWSWMNRHGKQVHLQVSPDDFDAAMDRIAANPDVDFVFDHLAMFPSAEGYPAEEPPYSRIAEVADYANAYVKVTHTPSQERFPFPDVHDHVRLLVDEFGSDRLVWGSDYIYHFKRVTPWQTREFLDELPFLSERDRENLLGETFRDLLP